MSTTNSRYFDEIKPELSLYSSNYAQCKGCDG